MTSCLGVQYCYVLKIDNTSVLNIWKCYEMMPKTTSHMQCIYGKS